MPFRLNRIRFASYPLPPNVCHAESLVRPRNQIPSPAVHVPVLLEECVDLLTPHQSLGKQPLFVDATFGGGSYTRAILDTIPNSRVIAIDQDPAAFNRAVELSRTEAYEGRITPIRGKFGELTSLLSTLDYKTPCLAGIVLDIGMSSDQLETPHRGFSYSIEGPLDMRMCADQVHGPKMDELTNKTLTAEYVVNNFSEEQLADIIYHYGQERRSRSIAHSIILARNKRPITSTRRLADIVTGSSKSHLQRRSGKRNDVWVRWRETSGCKNHNELCRGLKAAEELLLPHGRLVCVTFHSIEDRAVKDFLLSTSQSPRSLGLRFWKKLDGKTGIERMRRRYVKELRSPAALDAVFESDVKRMQDLARLHQDNSDAKLPSFEIVTRRAVKPSVDEIERNGRSRSAKLRCGERTANPPIFELEETWVP
ncbi:ribosomal RNA small subunit methyltransferase H [Zopfochytrium polystomum]|nr:ribosomal RNA small subunit methyltransferase H [Zopfochytrium polystomum]